MSVLEWLFESRNPNPGSVGDIEFGPPKPDDEDPDSPKRGLVWLKTIAGLALLGFFLYLIAQDSRHMTFIGRFALLVLYMVPGFYVTARPNYRNVGWLGGFADNPFRFSDDVNRSLIGLQVLLLPAKLMAYGLVMTWVIGRHYWHRRKRGIY